MATTLKLSKTSRERRSLLIVKSLSIIAISLMMACACTLAFASIAGTGPVSLALALAFATGAFGAECLVTIQGRKQITANNRLLTEAKFAKSQTDELFAMTDMLQAADGYDDATAVLQATTLRLLPGFGAALYVFNNSRDRLDLAGAWNMPDEYLPTETLAPANCWALKRGKPHINDPATGTLCCSHHASAVGTVEIPMMARGVVHGLFVLALDGPSSFDRLLEIRRVGRALADSMSLALSNISLREKLRTQSMRDPLTGLYNRRYMEDALERYLSLAQRSGNATSVLMLDLDNFKRLNDEFGHAKGDAVLRDAASQMVGVLRPSDVVCRYGGEEFLIILPDCSLEDASLKAEQVRARIEALSDSHQARITASLGVATVPTTASTRMDLIPLADAALMQAKTAGKNRVICADRRANHEENALRLAKTA